MGIRERLGERLGVLWRGEKDFTIADLEKLTVVELIKRGDWQFAKHRAKTADDFLALGRHQMDPLGKNRAGRGDYSPAESEHAAIVLARRFAREVGASEEVLSALKELGK